MYKIVEMSGLA